MEKIITCNNLKKNYGNLEILKGVNFSLDKNKSMSIVGKSGCGKTTLLQCLSSLDIYDEGQVILNNKDLKTLNKNGIQKLRRDDISFIFQEHMLLNELTLLENVLISSYINKKDYSKKADELLRILDIYDRKDQKVYKLSGGERQRGSIARALLKSPLLVFADEPTGHLDEKSAKISEELLFSALKETSASLILVTHNHDFAKKCDNNYILENGVLL